MLFWKSGLKTISSHQPLLAFKTLPTIKRNELLHQNYSMKPHGPTPLSISPCPATVLWRLRCYSWEPSKPRRLWPPDGEGISQNKRPREWPYSRGDRGLHKGFRSSGGEISDQNVFNLQKHVKNNAFLQAKEFMRQSVTVTLSTHPIHAKSIKQIMSHAILILRDMSRNWSGSLDAFWTCSREKPNCSACIDHLKPTNHGLWVIALKLSKSCQKGDWGNLKI